MSIADDQDLAAAARFRDSVVERADGWVIAEAYLAGLHAGRAEAEGLRARIRELDPPRGLCGRRYHAADCDCGGVAGDR